MSRTLHLSPIACLPSVMGEGKLVAFGCGHDELIYLVNALQPLDYQLKAPRAIFPKTIPDQRQAYRIVGLRGDVVALDLSIKDEIFNIHHVQPFGDEILLACARSHYRGLEDIERNGRVYSKNGAFSRAILLGDGIQSIQITPSGIIWTSYFDEGIFGNFGWKSPIGASGLVAFDSKGNKIYGFTPRSKMGSICDCYALNVESEQVTWCYYYTEFPLVRLCNRQIDAVWKMPLAGSDAFAISGNYALFRGGYKEHDTYQLFHLRPDETVEPLEKLILEDAHGKIIVADRAIGRANSIYLLSGDFIYQVDVESALQT